MYKFSLKDIDTFVIIELQQYITQGTETVKSLYLPFVYGRKRNLP